MKTRRILRNIFVSVAVLLALTQLLTAASFITFDVPGAGTGFNQRTAPLATTPEGVTMQLYSDPNYGHQGSCGSPKFH